MRFSEIQLEEAARIVRKRQMVLLENEWSLDIFQPSRELEKRIDDLNKMLFKGEIPAAKARMGWQYFCRRGIAAVLVCILISCAVVPDKVMAACHIMLNVIVSVFQDHTEFGMSSDLEETGKFLPVDFGYLPKELELVECTERSGSVDLLYMSETGKYFNIFQGIVMQNTVVNHGLDTESAEISIVRMDNVEVTIIGKEERFYFFWTADNYYYSGQTNLSEEEMVKIIKSIR